MNVQPDLLSRSRPFGPMGQAFLYLEPPVLSSIIYHPHLFIFAVFGQPIIYKLAQLYLGHLFQLPKWHHWSYHALRGSMHGLSLCKEQPLNENLLLGRYSHGGDDGDDVHVHALSRSMNEPHPLSSSHDVQALHHYVQRF